MFICTFQDSYGMGETIEEAISDLESQIGQGELLEEYTFYRAEEIKVKGKTTYTILQ